VAQRRGAGQLGTEIQVRATTENHKSVGPTIKVQLTTGVGTLITENFTDSSGMTRFTNVAPGTYRVRASGIGYQDIESDIFEVHDGESVSFQYLEMKPDEAAMKKAVAPGGAISAYALNVPDKARDQFLKGMELLKKNKHEEGMKKLAQATQTYPHYAEAWYWMGVASVPADMAAAKMYFEKALDADDDFLPTYPRYARLLIHEKDLARAEKLLTKSTGVNPQAAEDLFLLSYVQLLENRPADSIRTATRVHGMEHEKFPLVHIVAGEAYARTGENAKATEEFEIYLKEAPQGDQAEQARKAIAALQARK
jgi:tetratricopeptide (TPR) repeat protein